jgi:hypothetical protein
MLVPVFKCPICGSLLERRNVTACCSYCGAEEAPGDPGMPAPWRCPEGHFICPDCRTAKASDMPARVASKLRGTDPVAIAELIMAHPAFRQEAYGPDHHGVPALAILVAFRNAGLWEGSAPRILATVRRGQEIPAGSCFLTGTCGACVCGGAALSAVLGLDLRDGRRGIALEMVSRALGRLAQPGGVRCCKEAVYATIEAVLDSLAPHLPGVKALRTRPDACAFSASLPECKGSSCPYYPKRAEEDSKSHERGAIMQMGESPA